MAISKQQVLQNLKNEFTETEFTIFEGMLQGDNVKQAAGNLAISIQDAQAHRRYIYEECEKYIAFGKCGNRKQTLLMAYFATIPDIVGQQKDIVENTIKNQKINEAEQVMTELSSPIVFESCPTHASCDVYTTNDPTCTKKNCTIRMTRQAFKFYQECCAILGLKFGEHNLEELREILKDWKRSDEEFTKISNNNDFLKKDRDICRKESAKICKILIDELHQKDEPLSDIIARIKTENTELKAELESYKQKYHNKKLENFFDSVEQKCSGTVRHFEGNFFVFNPSHGQPRKVYNNYQIALADAMDIAKKQQTNTFVLHIKSLCIPHCKIETRDVSESGIDEKYVPLPAHDEIPY